MDIDGDIKNVLERILEEIQGMRSDFLEFTGHNAYKIEGVVSDLTGPLGYHLGDLNDRLSEIVDAIKSQ